MMIVANQYGLDWRPKVIVIDCGAANPGFAKRCMNIDEDESLKSFDVLRFPVPWFDWDMFIIWCADHVVKNMRNALCETWYKYKNIISMRYGLNGPALNWIFLLKAAKLPATIRSNIDGSVFGGFKPLTPRGVELSPNNSWDKMRMTHVFAITHDDTIE